MRKFLCFLLAAVALFSMIGCTPAGPAQTNTDTAPAPTEFDDPTGYSVNGPMAYPDYTFSGTPTTDELRATAVRAMRDLLSIRWSTPQEITYKKTGPVSDKLFRHEKDTTYAGVLYSSASAGLFQFLEFYNHETGRLEFPGTDSQLKKILGSSCADALVWSLNTVCNSIQGQYYPSTMTVTNGFYPVGSWTYDTSVTSFTFLPTYTILEQNTKQAVMESYAQVLPADTLVSSSDNHAMMAIEAAHTVYNDGVLNTAESYVLIQDQRGGQGSGFYEVKEDGELIQYSGRTSAKYTFDELYKKNYLPVSTAEFLGWKEYEQAQVTCDGDSANAASLVDCTLISNYPLAVVNAYLVYPDGGRVHLERATFSGDSKGGVPKEFALDELDVIKTGSFYAGLKPHNTYLLQIEAVVSTGQRFIAVETPVTVTE